MESAKFFNVTNHRLSNYQRQIVLNAGLEIVELPEELRKRWADVPPVANNEFVNRLAVDVYRFLVDSTPAFPSFALIQGEPVACFNVAVRCESIIPLVATTRRETVEEQQEDGSLKKVSVFKHVRFRPYKLYHEPLVSR